MALLLCFFGLHRWADWEYVDDRTCESVRRCRACQCIGPSVVRRHELFSEQEGCTEFRRCKRCPHSETNTEHELAERLDNFQEEKTRGGSTQTVIYVTTTTTVDVTEYCTRCSYFKCFTRTHSETEDVY
jgi:hypothetical protein